MGSVTVTVGFVIHDNSRLGNVGAVDEGNVCAELIDCLGEVAVRHCGEWLSVEPRGDGGGEEAAVVRLDNVGPEQAYVPARFIAGQFGDALVEALEVKISQWYRAVRERHGIAQGDDPVLEGPCVR